MSLTPVLLLGPTLKVFAGLSNLGNGWAEHKLANHRAFEDAVGELTDQEL